jgi:hypothetical protein
MKKTHDAAMVLIVRMYGERPRFNYYTGTSQGGAGLTVAQRYPPTTTASRQRAGRASDAHACP